MMEKTGTMVSFWQKRAGRLTWREQVRYTASMRKDGRTVTVFLTGGYCWHLFHWRFYDETREGRWNKQRLSLYGSVFLSYFICMFAYCIFSSYTVLFLTERAYSATVCGIITSLTFLANLLMEPVGGYITDTFLPTRRYLLLLIGMISALCIFCTKYMDQPWIMLPGMVLSAGIVYPFSQLMDAWVDISREKQPDLIYSRVRAGGSIGYAVMSVIMICLNTEAGMAIFSYKW